MVHLWLHQSLGEFCSLLHQKESKVHTPCVGDFLLTFCEEIKRTTLLPKISKGLSVLAQKPQIFPFKPKFIFTPVIQRLLADD